MFIDSSEAYNSFISFQESLCEDNYLSCILETDIADYFQRIYHHDLVDLLYGFGCDMDIVNCLASLLRKWRNGNSYGIPQSMWPSYLFGNAYLHELDTEMSFNENYKYIRYVDDIRVFCESATMAKKALMNICNTIRHLGLSVQPAKTYIHERSVFCSRIKPFSEKINDLIENRRVAVEFDWYFNEFVEIELPEEDAFISGVDEIFEAATHEIPIDEIAVKFCLNAYAFNHQPTAVQFCLGNLSKMPHLSAYFINYLTSLDVDNNVADQLLAFLKSDDNIYQWQEMWLLRYFFLLDRLDSKEREYLKVVFLDGNKHIACRSIAAQLLGKNNDLTDLRFLKNKFDGMTPMSIKRAIIMAIKDLPRSERNHIYNYWKTQNWCQNVTIHYVYNHDN